MNRGQTRRPCPTMRGHRGDLHRPSHPRAITLGVVSVPYTRKTDSSKHAMDADRPLAGLFCEGPKSAGACTCT